MACLTNSLFSGSIDDIRTPMFPDGNASVARLLQVDTQCGASMHDIAAQFDYTQLDQSANKNRLHPEQLAGKLCSQRQW